MRHMWVPQAFLNRATVVLIDQPSFCASYLAGSLSAYGVRVVGPFNSREELQDWLAAPGELPQAAIVAIDWLQGSYRDVLEQLGALGLPYILINNAPWLAIVDMPASFKWPYGAFQIVQSFQEIVAQYFDAMVPSPQPQTDQE